MLIPQLNIQDVCRVTVLFSAHYLIILNIFINLNEMTFYGSKSYRANEIFKLKITKGHTSLKIVIQDLVLSLCTIPDHAFRKNIF